MPVHWVDDHGGHGVALPFPLSIGRREGFCVVYTQPRRQNAQSVAVLMTTTQVSMSTNPVGLLVARPCTVDPNRLMSTEDVNKTVETMVSTRITALVRCVVCET